MTDIFISYAHEDRTRIKPLVEGLQQRGWTVWWDSHLRAGDDWQRKIEVALAEARCVIAVWSANSVESKWVRNEAGDGDQRGILVPVLIDPVAIPLAFRGIQAANLANWRGDLPSAEFEELAMAVAGLLKVPPPPKPPERSALRPKPRPMLLLGGLGLISVLGLILYFVSRPGRVPQPPADARNASTTPKLKVNTKDNLSYAWIPPGKFMMGCSSADLECGDDEKPAHEVAISRGFWMGQTEVTQAAYKLVTGKANPSDFKGDDRPVDSVSWEDADSYCAAVGMRLPTEAEWEYAARAGSTGARYGDLDAVAWSDYNSGNTTHPVALKAPNAWGLYDMLGNLWEWYGDSAGNNRALRGGSWSDNARSVRVSNRLRVELTLRDNAAGFRCSGDLL